MKPIFGVTYTFDGRCYGRPGVKMSGSTVLSGRNKAKSIRSFKRLHPNVRNLKPV